MQKLAYNTVQSTCETAALKFSKCKNFPGRTSGFGFGVTPRVKNHSNWLLEIAIIVLLLGDASFGADKTNKEKTVHDKVSVSFLSRYYQRDQHEVHNYTVTHLVVWFRFSLSAKEEELKSVETLFPDNKFILHLSSHITFFVHIGFFHTSFT